MKPGLNQSTQLRQELKINPRLYQAMDLLYMPLLDLQQHLKQELLNNPFLEMVEPEGGYYWDNKHGNTVAGIKMLVGAAIGKTFDDSIEGHLAF